jgi:hypothetical protein
LQHLGINPQRSLKDDMKLQTNVMHYGGNGVVISAPPSTEKQPATACACKCNGHGSEVKPQTTNNGEVDFKKMTPAQKIAYHKARWDRILG